MMRRLTGSLASATSPHFLIVTTSTAGFLHWLRHLHLNLRMLGGLDRFLRVCAADAATVALAAGRGVQSVALRHSAGGGRTSSTLKMADLGLPVDPGGAGTFMSSSWKSAVHFKQHCAWGLLEKMEAGALVLLVDSDVTFFQDPLPLLLPKPGTNSTDDVVLLDDTKPGTEPYMNSGFVLLRNTLATRAFGRAYLGQLERRRSENDQSVFNDVLKAMSVSGPFANTKAPMERSMFAASMGDSKMSSSVWLDGLHAEGTTFPTDAVDTADAQISHATTQHQPRPQAHGDAHATLSGPTSVVARGRYSRLGVRVLDSLHYSNGYLFYEFRHKRPLRPEALVLVHHNWIRGDKNKWERAKAYNAVITDPTESYRAFKDRTRNSMMRMRAWVYKDPNHPGNKPT